MKNDIKKGISFFKVKGIDAYPISNKTPGKKPDLELHIDNSLFGYCEIKSIVDYEFGGEKSDPTLNKVQNKIHEAAKQFVAYNPNHTVPNITLFMNHYRNAGFPDLWFVLTGQATHPEQPSDPIDVRYAKRLARKNDLSHIDYFIWFDAKTSLIYYAVNDTSSFKNSQRNNMFEGLRIFKC